MKRSQLQPGKGFKPPTQPMARGTARLVSTAQIQRTVGLKQGGQLARAPFIRAPGEQPKKRIRSRGLKGRTPTAAEQRFMDAAGAVPCLACLIDGRVNHHISLHHIDGRTKPGAHLLVLPLCAEHHQQDDTDPLRRPSLHGRKATFTARYGTEAELLAHLHALLGQ